MLPLKRPNEFNIDGSIKKTKLNHFHEGSFKYFPTELMEDVLARLSFTDLDNLLQVSKVFWQIIKRCRLPIKDSFQALDFVETRVASSFPLNISPRVKFWARFQTAVIMEFETTNKNEFKKQTKYLSSLLSIKTESGKALLPNINKLHVNIDDEDASKSLLRLEKSLKNKVSFSNLELNFYLFHKTNYSTIESRLKNVFNTINQLEEIILCPVIELTRNISSIAKTLLKFSTHMENLKSDLAKNSINCIFNGTEAINSLEIEKYEIDISEKTASRVRSIKRAFVKSIFEPTKACRELELDGAKPPSSFHILPAISIREHVNALQPKKGSDKKDLCNVKNLILNYKFDLDNDFEYTDEFINLLMGLGLEEIILRPEMSFSNDCLYNALAQLANEEFIQKLKTFSESKKITLGIDFSRAINFAVDEDNILVENRAPLKEMKQNLVQTNLSLACKKLQKIIHK